MATKHNGWGGARPGAGRKPGSKNDPSKISYSEAHRRKEVALAQQREFEVRRMGGELVDAARTRAALTALGRYLRDQIEQVPVRLAHALAHEHDPMKVEILLAHELREVLIHCAQAEREALERLV